LIKKIEKRPKRAARKVVPGILLTNLRNCAQALGSYYPDYLFGKGKVRNLAKVLIEVTFRCNCRCQMCPLYGVQSDGGTRLTESIKTNVEVTTQQYQKLFLDLKRLGTRSVNFTGGEPFLRKDILELARFAKESGIAVSFTTNAGVITKEVARRIVELGIDCVNISLDGPESVHEEIRKAKIFDRIMDAVDWIVEEKTRQRKTAPTLSFNCTISKLNQDHLEELLHVAHGKGLALTLNPMIFTTEEDNTATKRTFDEAFIKEESFVMPEEIGGVDTRRLEEELKRVAAKSRELHYPVDLTIVGRNNRKRFFDDPQFSVVSKCLAPWSGVRIDPYGTVYPCSLSVPMGNIKATPISEIVNGEKFVKFRNKLKQNDLFPSCKKCCVLHSDHAFWNVLPKW